jgi:alkylation response protein AidB-like acyl-CoA dehydrogenase
MTRDYLLTRKQYGQLLGDFQALRHRLADMFIETEQARSIILTGLEALVEAPAERRAALAAAVKARTAQAGLFVCGNAIQLHGGIGVTDEYPVGHFYKRIIAYDQRHGGSARQVERYAELAL